MRPTLKGRLSYYAIGADLVSPCKVNVLVLVPRYTREHMRKGSPQQVLF